MSKKIDQKEYLKKYLSGHKQKKQKKNKKHKDQPSSYQQKVKIIDDDLHAPEYVIDDELYGEDAPQIVGELTEELPSGKSGKCKWRSITFKEEDAKKHNHHDAERKNFGDSNTRPLEVIASSSPDTKLQKISSSYQKILKSDDHSPDRRHKTNADSFHRKHSKKLKRNHRSPSSEKRQPTVSSYQSYNKSSLSEDQSPPRKQAHNSERHKKKSDTLERNYSVKKEERTDNRRDSDLSPPRRNSDLSPPRRRELVATEKLPLSHKHTKRSTSPVHVKRELSPSLSPQCQSSTNRTRSRWIKSKRHSSDSLSPPQRDSDLSPPRRNSDLSPPRRKELVATEKLPLSHKHTKRRTSPVHVKRELSPNLSPQRQSFSTNRTRSRWTKSKRHNSESLSPPPTHKQKISKTLDGKRAGLQNSDALKKEMDERRRQEELIIANMTSERSAHIGEVQVRKTGRRGERARHAAEEDPNKQRIKDAHEKNKQNLYERWGKGLKQVEDYKSRMEEIQYESNKPLARHRDDEDLERLLREKEHPDDPMLEYMRKKRNAREKQEGHPTIPVYEGPYPENRFGIRPGYRWDGVDRSNGYEKKWFDMQNEKRAMRDEAYKYSVEDM